MKQLIKKILKESDEFDWVRDIEVKHDLTPAQIYHRYQTFPLEVVGPYIDGQFRDIYYEGGKLLLRVNGWENLSSLFENTDSRYGYVGRHLAELVLNDGDYWEPYYDIVSNWKSDVWELVEDDDDLLKYIKEYIVENDFIEKPLECDDCYDYDVLKMEMLDDSDVLGDIINDDEMFDDLKRELELAYESAYNTAARDEIFKSVYGSIKDLFGENSWVEIKRGGRTRHMLEFDVTGIVLESLQQSIDYCFDDCRRWWNPEKHYDPEDGLSEEETFENFCECIDNPFDKWGDFLGFYSDLLNESSDMLNPRYDEWPDSDDVKKYFSEDVYSRF